MTISPTFTSASRSARRWWSRADPVHQDLNAKSRANRAAFRAATISIMRLRASGTEFRKQSRRSTKDNRHLAHSRNCWEENGPATPTISRCFKIKHGIETYIRNVHVRTEFRDEQLLQHLDIATSYTRDPGPGLFNHHLLRIQAAVDRTEHLPVGLAFDQKFCGLDEHQARASGETDSRLRQQFVRFAPSILPANLAEYHEPGIAGRPNVVAPFLVGEPHHIVGNLDGRKAQSFCFVVELSGRFCALGRKNVFVKLSADERH